MASKLDSVEQEVRSLVESGTSDWKIAARFGVGETSVRRYRHKHGIGHSRSQNTTGAPMEGMQLVSEKTPDPGDLNRLLSERGLDPAQWVVVSATVNEWEALAPESEIQPLRQIKANIRPHLAGLIPARSDGWKAPDKPPDKQTDKPRLVVFLGDHHCPNHDPVLHGKVVEWIKKFKPDEGVILGDLLDMDAVSRHRSNPEWASSAQECVDAGYSVLRGYVQASPQTRWRALAGNHEDRLRNAVIDNLRGLYGLTQGATSDEERNLPVLSIRHLLRLDELGIEWEDAGGEYAQGQIQITPELGARHGWIARKGSGTSALATIDHLRYSVVIGHTHRQSVVHHTAHGIDGEPRTLLGAEAGTLARIKGGLSYAVAPDWQQGYCTASIWPDGRFKLDLATYVGGDLLWRDWRG